MNEFRMQLIDRMIRLYGLENEIVVEFCNLCERYANNETCDYMLEILVQAHEANPQF